MTASWFLRSIFGVLLLTMSLDMIRPMIAYRALELGATTAHVGYLAASYAILSFLIAAPTGQWVDRIGETRFIMVGAGVMAMMALALAAAGSLVALGVAQALLGAGQIFSLVALQTLVANCSPGHEREARFGVFAVMGSVGQVAGPAIGGFISSVSDGATRPVFLAGGGVLVALLVVSCSLHLRPPPNRERRATGATRPDATLPAMLKVVRIRSMPQAMLASLTVLATIDILIAYVPVYGEANGIPVATVGLLLSARAAASAASRLAMVPLLRALGRRRLFVLGLLMPAGALALWPLVSPVAVLFLLMVLAGFGLGLGQPMSLAWVTNAAPPDARGIAVGVRLTGNRAGQVLLPAVFGAFGGAAGVAAIFVALGVLLAASAGVVMTATFDEPPT